jgi:dihydroorotase
MLGLETALSVAVLTLVETGLLDWRGLADRMAVWPARIGGLADAGRDLAEGEPASLVLVDPAARWPVDPAASASRSRNTPYAGRELPGRVVATFRRGEPTVLDGKATR